MKRSTSIAVTAISAAVSLAAYFYFSKWLGARDPWFTATGLLLAVFIHELGHLVVFEYSGIKAHVVLLGLFGGAVPDREHRQAYDSLPAPNKAAIMLAGVSGNLLFAIVACLLYGAGALSGFSCDRIVNLNGGIIMFNLLPLWKLDGGRFAKLLFDSIPGSQGDVWIKDLTIVVVSGFIAIMIASRATQFVPLALLVYGIHKQSHHDDPNYVRSPKALKVRERFMWASIYVALLLVGTAMSSSSPDFMKPKLPSYGNGKPAAMP